MLTGPWLLLQKNGNEVWTVILTTGNVGTLDPKLARFDLARIRRQEQIDAMAELGIPADHYINLGYDDELIEFENRERDRGPSGPADSTDSTRCPIRFRSRPSLPTLAQVRPSHGSLSGCRCGPGGHVETAL